MIHRYIHWIKKRSYWYSGSHSKTKHHVVWNSDHAMTKQWFCDFPNAPLVYHREAWHCFSKRHRLDTTWAPGKMRRTVSHSHRAPSSIDPSSCPASPSGRIARWVWVHHLQQRSFLLAVLTILDLLGHQRLGRRVSHRHLLIQIIYLLLQPRTMVRQPRN